jgi:hypothetical protein
MKDKYLVLVYSDTEVSQHFYQHDSLEEAKLALSTLKILKESIFGTNIPSPIKSLKLVKVTEIL